MAPGRTVVRARRAIVHDGRPVERAADVVVAGERVVAVEPYGSASGELVELADDEVLLPGLVDTHVHCNDPGRADWEGFGTATLAAAAGGVTTVVDMPLNSLPPTVDLPSLAAKRAVAVGRCAVDVGFWAGAVPGHLHDLRPLLAAGAFGAKCFTVDSGVPEFPPLDPAGVEAAMRELAAVDGLLLVHAEDPAVLASAPQPDGRSYARFLASRPAAAEDRAVAGVLAAAARTGCRVHVVHVASAGVLDLVRAARAEGVAVTVETCPHYLSLDGDDAPDGATHWKCCPPVRGGAHREALWRGLADGTVDAVVSDHSPCPPTLKALDSGDFAAAWGGISSLQLGLPVVWTQARRRGHGLADVVAWMAAGPARVAGLAGKGRIAPGCDADLVVLAPDVEQVVEPATLRQRHPLTPYAGHRLTGSVRRTWLRGRPLDLDGRPRGRLLVAGGA